MMKIAVYWTDKLDEYSYSPRWAEYLQNRGVEVLKLDLKRSDVMQQLKDCDGVMWHWYHIPDDKQSAPKILDAIETNLGIAVFPDHNSRWHYDEKVAQHYLLEALDAPRIKSWVFWDYAEAVRFAQSAQYPMVFKLSVGAASANVIKVHNSAEALRQIDKTFKGVYFPYSLNEFEFKSRLLSPAYYKGIIKRALRSLPYIFTNQYPPLPEYYLLQKNYAYFQEFCADNSHDIRVTVIGNRAWAFTRENRSGDFRASGSGRVDYDEAKIPPGAIKLAFELSRKIGAQSLAYDIMFDNQRRLVINEISYCYVFKAVLNAPGYWDEELAWHEGHCYPQDAMAEDLMQRITTKKEAGMQRIRD
jgi:glutathione synthase/RimK-type ligase-like ATP-grasp enzyme